MPHRDVSIEEVFSLERRMLEMPQVELPVRHFFSDGVYAREMSVPAGHVVTGAVHKYRQLHIISKGSCQVNINGTMQHIQAPYTFVAEPGAKRAIYVTSDLVWTTILHTQETDVAAIEKHFTCSTEQEYLTWHSQLVLSSPLALSPSQQLE